MGVAECAMFVVEVVVEGQFLTAEVSEGSFQMDM